MTEPPMIKTEIKKIVTITEDGLKQMAKAAVGAPDDATIQMETDHSGITDFRVIWFIKEETK